MTPYAAGQILFGSDGSVHIRIWGERYYISPGDLGMLFFVGDIVPVLKRVKASTGTRQVSGSAFLSPSGQAVLIEIGSQRYMLPRDKFIAVAFGEAVSGLFFEVPEDAPEIEIISPRKGGAIS